MTACDFQENEVVRGSCIYCITLLGLFVETCSHIIHNYL
jgi:hypothetical protein